MSSHHSHQPLPGSERTMLPGARQMGPVKPEEPMEVSVYLKARGSAKALEALANQLPGQRQHLSQAEFAAQQGADPDAIAKVEAFAHEHNLTIVDVNPARRVIVLAGTATMMSSAFQVELHYYEHPQGHFRGRTGTVQLPADLIPIVEGVFGLDDRPQARAHYRRLETRAAAQATTAYTPPQLAALYDFPTQLNGQGQSIAIIELGGGYRSSDLRAYFSRLGLPLPKVVSVSVDRGRNSPSTADSADGEVELDIQVAGAIAPAARLVVYFAPNSDRGFLDAVTTAIHDTRYRPSVISISWGGPESTWTAQALQAMDQAFQSAAALGVTVCCAAGDGGSSDGVTDGRAHVDFPASSPYALACGGTRLESANGQVTSEVVWNNTGKGATGGGISDVFALPAWQVGAGIPPSSNPDGRVGRGVPDVAGDADPETGYQIQVDGQLFVFGGTSAVSPLWAGLLALINQKLGKAVGYLNPVLYQQLAQTSVLRDVTSGNNGAYQANPGWDACTGLGSPDGAKLLQALTGTQL
ncbi:S53 family peptidase [Stenomitos frigidus]|uniref:Peptidase S53 n=1 Tax=Stenomitos frigidus ULC18 TaxID=2107698 RepID=A0A2T1E0E3_9CYAN|nr:S53 family peptidase [Stenomitos frigidus]PSB26202.1 peptidase S53 [Stenomitos frigidus ULC18]